MVTPKNLKDFLEEDKSLTTPMTYEEFNRVESGFDDSGIENAYEAYKRVLESQRCHSQEVKEAVCKTAISGSIPDIASNNGIAYRRRKAKP